jgi:hypothetical protein
MQDFKEKALASLFQLKRKTLFNYSDFDQEETISSGGLP